MIFETFMFNIDLWVLKFVKDAQDGRNSTL